MKIEFETDNAAFEENGIANETSVILKRITELLDHGFTEGKCWDSNGNSVGEWSLDQ